MKITTEEIIQSCIEYRKEKFLDHFNTWLRFEEGRIEREGLEGLQKHQQESFIQGAQIVARMFEDEIYLNK